MSLTGNSSHVVMISEHQYMQGMTASSRFKNRICESDSPNTYANRSFIIPDLISGVMLCWCCSSQYSNTRRTRWGSQRLCTAPAAPSQSSPSQPAHRSRWRSRHALYKCLYIHFHIRRSPFCLCCGLRREREKTWHDNADRVHVIIGSLSFSKLINMCISKYNAWKKCNLSTPGLIQL